MQIGAPKGHRKGEAWLQAADFKQVILQLLASSSKFSSLASLARSDCGGLAYLGIAKGVGFAPSRFHLSPWCTMFDGFTSLALENASFIKFHPVSCRFIAFRTFISVPNVDLWGCSCQPEHMFSLLNRSRWSHALLLEEPNFQGSSLNCLNSPEMPGKHGGGRVIPGPIPSWWSRW